MTEDKTMTILRGVRPAALAAVSERERLMAHPHRAQAAVNHVRALQRAAVRNAVRELDEQQPLTDVRGSDGASDGDGGAGAGKGTGKAACPTKKGKKK